MIYNGNRILSKSEVTIDGLDKDDENVFSPGQY